MTSLSRVLHLALLFATLTLQWGIRTTACATEYFPGIVIFAFKAEYMPNQADVNLQTCSFTIQPLDSIIAARQGTLIRKLRPAYSDEYTSETAAILGRTFILEYKDGTDPAAFVSELSTLPYFETVEGNPKVQIEFHGTQQYMPNDYYFDPEQWYLHSVRDSEDIDAPEAWAIEKGDPNLIIGITDSGTMIDTFHVPVFELHPDFDHYFNAIEDFNPLLALTWADVDTFDDTPGPEPDPDDRSDNVIGTNFDQVPRWATDRNKIKFWESQPIDAQIEGTPEDPWRLVQYKTHGLNVASIAAAMEGDPGPPPPPPPTFPNRTTVGVAFQCKVYHTRIHEGNPLVLAAVVEHAAFYSTKVINMSWGVTDNPGDTFERRIKEIATEDDVVLVASVGNFTSGAGEVAWPARYDFVLGVGNMTRANTDDHPSENPLHRYSESRYGPDVGPLCQ